MWKKVLSLFYPFGTFIFAHTAGGGDNDSLLLGA